MGILIALLSLFSLLSSFVSSSPLLPRTAPPGNALLRTVYSFPNETWVENLATRSNGKTLVTLIQQPEIWEIDTTVHPATAELIYSFPDALSCLGIVEYAPDVFAVNVGNWSDVTEKPTKGSWSVWSVDLSKKHRWDSGTESGATKVSKITDIPSAVFLNGMALLPSNPDIILSGDSARGLIYRINVRTGAHSVAIDNKDLKTPASLPLKLGVNGIQFRDGEPDAIYFGNSLKAPHFGRIPIDPTTGAQTGPVDVIFGKAPYPTNIGAVDDFTFDTEGNAWLATDPSDEIVKYDFETGKAEVVVGKLGSSIVAGNTACHFGKTEEDLRKGTLYIVTNGGLAAPPKGGIVGGQVFALDTAEL